MDDRILVTSLHYNILLYYSHFIKIAFTCSVTLHRFNSIENDANRGHDS